MDGCLVGALPLNRQAFADNKSVITAGRISGFIGIGPVKCSGEIDSVAIGSRRVSARKSFARRSGRKAIIAAALVVARRIIGINRGRLGARNSRREKQSDWQKRKEYFK